MVAQEDGPLAALRDVRGLVEDVDQGKAVLHLQGHEHARHEGKVKGHVAFVAGAEVGDRVFGPLVGLGEQHPVGEFLVDVGPQFFEKVVGLGEVLAVGPLPFEKVGHRIEAQPVHAHAEPEVEHPQHLLLHARIVEVEIGLVSVEAVPVVGLGHRVPGPVGRLEILKDDAGVPVPLRRVAPDVVIAMDRSRSRPAGALEPGVLVRGVIQHQLGDHPQAPAVGRTQKVLEIPQGVVDRIDPVVIGDVVAIVPQRRRVEGEQPDGGDPQVLQIVESLDQASEIADAVAVGIAEGLDVQLVDDRLAVPGGVVCQSCFILGHERILEIRCQVSGIGYRVAFGTRDAV